MGRLATRHILWLALIAAACNHTAEPEDSDPDSLWIAYTFRGRLHRVRGDGSGHALLRNVQRRESMPAEPDVKLYDMWADPVAQPGTERIAAIRGRNLAFNMHPGDPAEFNQSWELVLVDPAASAADRVLFASKRRLSDIRWSDDGKQIVARSGRRDVIVWHEGRAEVHALAVPPTDPERESMVLADFTRDGKSLVILMNRFLELPYLVGTAPLGAGNLEVTPSFTFPNFKVPEERRQAATMVRLLGRGTEGSALGLPFFVSPERRFSFYHRKREGFLPRGWIEGIDGDTGKTFEVRTTWRGIYAE